MNAVEQGYNYLSCDLLHSTTKWFLPVTSLVSFSLLTLILLHRYIKYRRMRQAHITSTSGFKEKNQDVWLQSTAMEKGNILSPGSHPSACDILQPLSRTSLLPSSGALAARAREQQSGSAASSMASSPDCEVQKHIESTQQMCDEDAGGVRTWKRLVVEYR
ncbi:hypothetical protein CBS147333_5294 [Penicillium roqueforti]|nr:hypothetical protein CBS147355_372 [Penicillium roqueforti]KAI2728139.1 hypothetical protein CBS147354_2672 [Penicillium roqueforti]KAI3109647.1 hypothetical protein CBS147333_5294 [Penicillium roqueforti]KAI3145056.1 hypothetical protein CBS147326_6 [Penicillium roqueforti]KAI3211221.1 hypothetical protein CBS147311_857 [Penicillium roqueforti]